MSWSKRSVQKGLQVRRFLHQKVEGHTHLLAQQQQIRANVNEIKEAQEKEIALPVLGYGDLRGFGHSYFHVHEEASLRPSDLEADLQERFHCFNFSSSHLASWVQSNLNRAYENPIIPVSFYDDSRFAYACDSAAYRRLCQTHPTSSLGMWVRERLHQGRMLLVSPHPFDDVQGGGSQEEELAFGWRYRKLRPGYDTAITRAEMDTVFRFLEIPPLAQTTTLRNSLLQFIIANSASLWRRDYHRLMIYVTGYRCLAELLSSKLPALTLALSSIGFRECLENGDIDGVVQVWDCLDSDSHPKELPDIGHFPHGLDLFGENRRMRGFESWFERRLNLQNWREFPVDPSFWDAFYSRWWSYWDKEHILYRQGIQNYFPRIDDSGLVYVCDQSAYAVLSDATSTPSCNINKLAEWAQQRLNEGRLYVTYPIKPPPPWKTWPDDVNFDLERAEKRKQVITENADEHSSGCLDMLWHGNKDDLRRYASAISLLEYEWDHNNIVYVTGDRQFVETVLKSPTRREALFRAADFFLVHNMKQVYDCITEPGDIDITGFSDLDVEESTLSLLDMRLLD